jgi:hypothetical protein
MAGGGRARRGVAVRSRRGALAGRSEPDGLREKEGVGVCVRGGAKMV